MELRIDVTPSSSNGYGLSSNSPYRVVDFHELQFPNFQQIKRLGRGSYGTVIQAKFENQPVAIKLLDRDLDHSHIHNEAKILSSFKHNNIIKLFAAFHGEQSGLILELMEGGSLHELLHQHKHIQYFACHVVGWSQQVLEALNYLHNKLQLVHRDLKPLNMLLTNDFITLKLCDFGTAAELRTSMTNNRGSAAWMAPEVFRGRKYDEKCDVFSFGIFLWELISRRTPFEDWDSNAYAILWQVSEGRRPADIKDCPKPLMDLIKSCWADRPRERPNVECIMNAIEMLCYIYPNRYLPLIDRTTKMQAFAHPINISPQSYFQPHQQPFIPSTQPYTSHQNNNVQLKQLHPQISHQLPPIPPPPKFGHRRTGSHDLNNTQSSSSTFYNQPQSQAQTIVSQGQTINYNPLTSQTPPPYRPVNYNVHSPNRIPPPPQFMPSSLQVPSPISTRRSSEPPPSSGDESVGKRKGSRIKTFLNGIRKL